MKEKLQTMDAQTLMTTPMQPLKFIVEGLIPQGLHILAGSPKIGKSWLSLWVCLQVVKGEKVWEFETTKSEVLYLCLEDSFARIQSRLFEITDDAPSTLHFAIMSDSIGNGLENQIEDFINAHPNTGLIVIDTLQKVRKTVSANVNPYAADYDDINALKQIADKYKISVLEPMNRPKAGWDSLKATIPLEITSFIWGAIWKALARFHHQLHLRLGQTESKNKEKISKSLPPVISCKASRSKILR